MDREEENKDLIFVPVKPDRKLEPNTSNKTGRALFIAVICIGVGIIIFMATGKFVQTMLNLPMIVIILIYVFLVASVTKSLVLSLVYDSKTRLIERSATKGRKELVRSSVWSMSNTLQEATFGDSSEYKAVIIKYGSKIGLVLNVIEGCVEAYPKADEKYFYRTRQNLIDTFIKRKYKIDTLEKNFNPDEDIAWSYMKRKQIEMSERYKKEGLQSDALNDLLNDMRNSLYAHCIKYSRVTSNYIFVTKVGCTVKELIYLFNTCHIHTATIKPADLATLNSCLATYYGDESLQVSNEVPAVLKNGIKTKSKIEYIGFITSDGKFVQENTKPAISLKTDFGFTEYVAPPKPKKKKEITENNSIFYKDI